MSEMPLLACPVNERQATLIPQMNIQENDVRQGFRCNAYEALFQSLRKDCFMALGFKPGLEEIAILRIIIHYKDPLVHSVSFILGMAAVVNRSPKPGHHDGHTIVPTAICL